MTLEPLKVDAELLGAAGQRLLAAAQGLPDAPEPFTPSYGTDALSEALSTDVPKAEAPIIEGLPPLKTSAISTAESVVEAARRYTSTDSGLKGKYDELQFGGSGGSGGSGAGGVGAAGVPGSVPATASAPAATAAAAASPAGSMGQMMGMPMQMAQQAAQVPMQMAGMAGSIPQTAMQGAQQVGQQVSQLVEQFGGQDDELKSDEPRDDEPKEGERAEGAASGQDGAERAPADPETSGQSAPELNL